MRSSPLPERFLAIVIFFPWCLCFAQDSSSYTVYLKSRVFLPPADQTSRPQLL
jgi:hypothetical protein